MQVDKKKPIYQIGDVGWHEFYPNKIILNLNLQKKVSDLSRVDE